ncbi:MAG: glycosyltransferase family 4 protein [Propionibacteriales bacterium]|nr:glycosyltransferase family 4 protein [Propionibacteriales bacterium]
MKVGLVCPYSFDVPGGVQNHVRDLADVLSRRGHVVGVLAPGERDAGLAPYVETVGRAVPVRYNGSVARLAFGPRVANRTRRWLRDGDFDVLHVHEPTTPSVSLLALWAAEGPVVATFHTANVRSRSLTSAAALLRPSLEKVSARIAVSEAARDTLVQHIGGEPMVIPNGVWCRSFEQARPRPAWERPGPTLAFLGRTDEPRKGLRVLLGTFPSVLDQYPSARLLVAGRGDADVLEALPARLRDRVELLGQVSDDDKAALLASVTVYVAPHTGGESFGVVLLEAMAAGAAVVASDLRPFRAVLDEGALGELFRAGDPAAAAEAICRVLDDPGRREQARRRAAVAVRRYDWSQVVTEIEAVYDAVASRGSKQTVS